jgi:hypothetical protein
MTDDQAALLAKHVEEIVADPEQWLANHEDCDSYGDQKWLQMWASEEKEKQKKEKLEEFKLWLEERKLTKWEELAYYVFASVEPEMEGLSDNIEHLYATQGVPAAEKAR